MKKSKHTPGPWTIETYHGSMFKITKPDFKIGDEVAHRLKYDAALISACPDMLEALESYVAFLQYESQETLDIIENRMMNAIAKARGES